jgi:hypothetical protein
MTTVTPERKRRIIAIQILLAAVALATGGAQDGSLGPSKPPEGLKPIKISETEVKLGGLSFNPKTREIWFPCRVNQDDVVLEFAICEEERGKLHESLLSTKVTPFEIQIAMKLLRWEASRRDIYPKFDDEGKIIGNLKDDGKGRMEILVRHKGDDGEETTEPIGNWMHNDQTKVVVGAGVWTYTGSKVVDGYFLATEDGAIAANYRYEGSLCNAFNPGSDDDELWFPIADKVPPLDTEVTVILKPLKDVEVAEARRLKAEPEDKKSKDKPESNPDKK